MKNFVFACLVAAAFFLLPALSFAHDIIPPTLGDFLAEYPNATDQQVRDFISRENIRLHGAGGQALEVVRSARAQVPFFTNVVNFIAIGIEHILLGFDHLMFVAAMMLSRKRFRDILRLTFAFTVAHSITLILSMGLGWTLPGRVVEPMIAFSIAYVALTSLWLPVQEERYARRRELVTVFLFGLFHGLGFAGALREVHVPAARFFSSLLSFNVGVELGQVAAVIAFLILLEFIRRRQWEAVAIRFAGSAIALLGIYWGIERLLS